MSQTASPVQHLPLSEDAATPDWCAANPGRALHAGARWLSQPHVVAELSWRPLELPEPEEPPELATWRQAEDELVRAQEAYQEAQGAMDRSPGPRGAVRAGQALTEAWRYRAACQVAAAEAEVAYRRVVALGNRPVPAEVTEGAQQLRFVLRDVLCALARLEAVRADATPAGRRTSGRYHIDDGARSAASTRLREVREEMQAGPPSEIVEAAAMAKARTL